jgi:hypothetical protein
MCDHHRDPVLVLDKLAEVLAAEYVCADVLEDNVHGMWCRFGLRPLLLEHREQPLPCVLLPCLQLSPPFVGLRSRVQALLELVQLLLLLRIVLPPSLQGAKPYVRLLGGAVSTE